VYKGGDQEVPKDVERVRIDPSVKVIKERAFVNCRKLKYVQFCEGLEEIGPGAFGCCISLESVRLPSTTKIIRQSAFFDCVKVEYVILNEGLQDIGKNNAFSGCRMIKFVCLPSTVRRLKDGAFADCSNLTKAALNEGLETVGKFAFHGCNKLETIVIPFKKTRISSSAIPVKTKRETTKNEEFWNSIRSRDEAAEKARIEKYGMVLVNGNENQSTGAMAPAKKKMQQETNADWKQHLLDLQEQIKTLQKTLQETLQNANAKEQDARDQLAASRAREEQTRELAEALVNVRMELDSKRKECFDLQQDNDTKQARHCELEEALETCHVQAKEEQQAAKLKLESLLERVRIEKEIIAQQHHDLKQEQELVKKQHCSLAASHGVAKVSLEALKDELGAVSTLYKETHKELVSTKRKRDELKIWQDEQKAVDAKDEAARKKSRWW